MNPRIRSIQMLLETHPLPFSHSQKVETEIARWHLQLIRQIVHQESSGITCLNLQNFGSGKRNHLCVQANIWCHLCHLTSVQLFVSLPPSSSGSAICSPWTPRGAASACRPSGAAKPCRGWVPAHDRRCGKQHLDAPCCGPLWWYYVTILRYNHIFTYRYIHTYPWWNRYYMVLCSV